MVGEIIPQKLQLASEKELEKIVQDSGLEKYGQPCKSLQTDCVVSLIQGKNTFLLAATGFGKSRISELFLNLTTKDRLGKIEGVVLVLNPLDALGENQVEEKKMAGFTAINATKLNFNHAVAIKIKNGYYNFVYVSPELFLDNKLFNDLYLSPVFQHKLALVVVDEAHMIYSWGLVEDGQRHNKSHTRHCDRGVFRPSYGKIGGQLLIKHKAPLLLMSATCRPPAITAIKKNLKLVESNIKLLQGELSRPEIRIVRIPMLHPLSTCADLLQLYSSKEENPDESLVPSLIYSGTRGLTLKVMEVLNQARGTPEGHLVPRSPFVRRFHAVTGELDKKECLDDFGQGKVAIISCTLALGMGQNWKLVRQVVVLGRGDPSLICQMIGRCGRDGRPGLAIIFMEPHRKGGKNKIEDFKEGTPQSDDDRMDALAITPVCLRIAFSVDNLVGYIPLSFDDPEYKKEALREISKGFAPCMCSNCMQHAAETLIQEMPNVNKLNFDNYILNKYVLVARTTIQAKRKYNVAPKQQVQHAPYSLEALTGLRELLVQDFSMFFKQKLGSGGSLVPADLFGDNQIEGLTKQIQDINTLDDIRRVIHGEALTGQLQMLLDTIVRFRANTVKQSNPRALVELGPNTNGARAKRPRAVAVDQSDISVKKRRAPRSSSEVARERARVAEESKEKKEAKKTIKRQKEELKLEQRKRQEAIMAEVKRDHGIV